MENNCKKEITLKSENGTACKNQKNGCFANRSFYGENLFVLMLFILLTLLFTYPIIRNINNAIAGGYGDPLLNTWIIAHDIRTIFTSPTSLFDGNIMYPARDVLTYSEHLVSLSLIGAPVYFVTKSPLITYNFLLITGFIMSAFGAFLLVKYLTGNIWAGIVGGLIFAFIPYKFAQISHIQICFSGFLPFTLYYLHRYLDTGKKREVFLFGLFYTAQCLASWYYLIYVTLLVLGIIAFVTVFRWSITGLKRLYPLAVTGIVSVAIVVPFAIPYMNTQKRFLDFQRPFSEAEHFAASPRDYFNVFDNSVIYGSFGRFFQQYGVGNEKVLFPGIMALVLVAAALLCLLWLIICRIRKKRDLSSGDTEHDNASDKSPLRKPSFLSDSMNRRRVEIAAYIALALLFFILTFGPYILGRENYIYTLLYNVGFLKLTRVPARFAIPMSISIAVLAGFGLNEIINRARRVEAKQHFKTAIAAGITALVILDVAVLGLSVNHVPAGDAVPEVYNWLKEQGDVVVIEMPASDQEPAVEYGGQVRFLPSLQGFFIPRAGFSMHFSTYHWKDIVNGYSGYFPFFYNKIMVEMQGFPSERTIGMLEALSVDYVIWNMEWVDEDKRGDFDKRLRSSENISIVETFGKTDVYRVENRGAPAEFSDLKMELIAPKKVSGEGAIGMGLMFTNDSEKSFVSMDETLYEIEVTLECDSGFLLTHEQKSHLPFFLDPGESFFVAVELEKSLSSDDYEIFAEISGENLNESMGGGKIHVDKSLRGLEERGLFDGEIGFLKHLPDDGVVEAHHRDGLLYDGLTVVNTGNVPWRTVPNGDEMYGMTRIAVDFYQNGNRVWEEQRCGLPCDVSLGQEVFLPMLIRIPADPGKYDVVLTMVREGYERFGEKLEFILEIK